MNKLYSVSTNYVKNLFWNPIIGFVMHLLVWLLFEKALIFNKANLHSVIDWDEIEKDYKLVASKLGNTIIFIGERSFEQRKKIVAMQKKTFK